MVVLLAYENKTNGLSSLRISYGFKEKGYTITRNIKVSISMIFSLSKRFLQCLFWDQGITPYI